MSDRTHEVTISGFSNAEASQAVHELYTRLDDAKAEIVHIRDGVFGVKISRLTKEEHEGIDWLEGYIRKHILHEGG